MRALFVVLAAPSFDSLLRVLHVEEPIQVEALVPECAVERLDQSVLGRYISQNRNLLWSLLFTERMYSTVVKLLLF